LLSLPKAMTKYNPFLIRKQVRVVILPHRRRINDIEIHSYPIREKINPNEFLLLYRDWRSNQLPKSKNITFPLFFDLFKRILFHRPSCYSYLDESAQLLLGKVERNIQNDFGFRLDLCTIVAKHLNVFL